MPKQTLQRPVPSTPSNTLTARPKSAAVHHSPTSAGFTLDSKTTHHMGAHFGHDFSQVRVHTDTRAAEAAQSLGAKAYTLGADIVFGPGHYAPGTEAGDRLLAHELTHVTQQARYGTGDPSRNSRREDESEQEAERLAAQVMAGQSVQVRVSPGASIAREEDPFSSSLGSLLGVANDATGGLVPGLGFAGKALKASGDAQKGITADGSAGTASGALGFGSGILEMAKMFGERDGPEGIGEKAVGGLGVAAGAAGFAQSGFDAYSDFSKGNYGSGAFDLVKGAGQSLSTLAAMPGVVPGVGGEAFSLFGAGGVGAGLSTVGGAFAEGGISGAASTLMPAMSSMLGISAEGAATLPGVAGMEAFGAEGALMGGGAEGLAALGPVGAVIGSGVAGVEAGIGLDKLTNWAGQKIMGDDKGDYSISNALSHVMTGADNMFTGAMRGIGAYDDSKPAYTQSVGMGLANLFTPTADASGHEDSFTDRLGKLF